MDLVQNRLSTDDILIDILGSENVYFQPPNDILMQYPCIVYKRDDIKLRHADNVVYDKNPRYQVTYIDRQPDSDVLEKLASLPKCSFERHYTADDLNHDVFNIFF